MRAFGIFFWDAEVEAWLLEVIVSKGVSKVAWVWRCAAHVLHG